MKREILCDSCTEDAKDMHGSGPETEYPNEYVNFQPGKARAKMVCDQCNVKISPGDNCNAFSIYTRRDLEKVDMQSEFLLRWPVELITLEPHE